MRCPSCKKNLILGKPERYETLEEHVSDPNQEITCKRPTYVCPVCYPDAFFDDSGAFYGKGSGVAVAGALDSVKRRISIWICLDGIKRHGGTDRVEALRIVGENDIPPPDVLQVLVGKEFCAI